MDAIEPLTNEELALTAASQAFCNRGITIACPWDGDMSDEERERFDALVAAITSYNTMLANLTSNPSTPPAADDVSESGEAKPVAWQGVAPDGRVDITRSKMLAEQWRMVDWCVRPLYSSPSPQPETAHQGQGTVGDGIWRDLALQFDGHRIEALALLRHVSEATNMFEAVGRMGEIKAFLAKPPLSGEAVLAARIAALPPARVEAAPRVKPLWWVDRVDDDEGGGTDVVGSAAQTAYPQQYWTSLHHEEDGNWRLYFGLSILGRFETEDKAKAAARADYEARILSALEPVKETA